MASARRFLQTNSGLYPTLPAAEPPDPLAVDSDVVVILAALLCALICVVGLAAVARCARARRNNNNNGAASPNAASKGLKKKALRALPKLAYEDAMAAAIAARGGASSETETVLAECAICLSEFAEKEEIRVLPQCGHAFHVACVDTWLAAHSSCPSCRRVLVVDDATPKLKLQPPEPKRCRNCEAMEEASSSSGDGGAVLQDIFQSLLDERWFVLSHCGAISEIYYNGTIVTAMLIPTPVITLMKSSIYTFQANALRTALIKNEVIEANSIHRLLIVCQHSRDGCDYCRTNKPDRHDGSFHR
ncbi:hypothetical protein EJB05_08162, partial [Eragrostis curvula]